MRKPRSHTEAITQRYTNGAAPSYEEAHTTKVFVPFPQVESERAKRGKNAAKLFKQGLRMFRVGSERGAIVQVAIIDERTGIAGAIGLRKRLRTVALCDLFPMHGDSNG